MAKIYSKDMSSAYPAVMLQKKFPMSRFVRRTASAFDKLLSEEKHALLIDCRLINLNIKTIETIPYIAFAKKTMIRGGRYDNGRVLSADEIGLILTDVDFRIISEQYNFDSIEIDNLYAAKYDYLPNEFREYIFERYIKKCNLKNGDEYLYSKEKNKINALFGMGLTDIVHDEIIYNELVLNPFTKEKADIYIELEKHYESKSTFLVYQWGLWVTAWCRWRLQKAIMGIGRDIIYCDTDSAKYFGNHEDLFVELNNEILHETELCGFNTEYTRPDGKKFSLGLWEDDDNTPYEKFVTLGSKKYAYVDSESEFHNTVAGLSKHKAKQWFDSNGGIEEFKIGTEIPVEYSGRTTAHYDDRIEPYELTVYDTQQGEYITFKSGSSIAIENVSYTFGISDDYAELLESLDKPIM